MEVRKVLGIESGEELEEGEMEGQEEKAENGTSGGIAEGNGTITNGT